MKKNIINEDNKNNIDENIKNNINGNTQNNIYEKNNNNNEKSFIEIDTNINEIDLIIKSFYEKIIKFTFKLFYWLKKMGMIL